MYSKACAIRRAASVSMPLPDAATMGSNGLRAWSAQRLRASSSDITSSTVHRRCELYNGNLRNLLSTLSLSNRNVLRFAPYWLCMLVGLGCWVYAAYMLLAYPAEQSDSLGPIGSNWIDPLVFIWLGAATMVAGYALWVVSSNEEFVHHPCCTLRKGPPPYLWPRKGTRSSLPPPMDFGAPILSAHTVRVSNWRVAQTPPMMKCSLAPCRRQRTRHANLVGFHRVRRQVNTSRASGISPIPALKLLQNSCLALLGSGRCPKSTLFRPKLIPSAANSDGTSE